MEAEFASSVWPNLDARRGWAARQFLVDDARWVADVVQTTSGSEVGAYCALMLGHHFVRIAYEGTIALRSTNPHVGWPELAALLDNEISAITARVRHLTKLLDDSKKSYDDLLADLDAKWRGHRKAFKGNVRRPFRWLQTDLGLYRIDGALVGATMPIGYRLPVDPVAETSVGGEATLEVAQRMGGNCRVLTAATLEPLMEPANLDVPELIVTSQDVRSDKYLAGRYERDFPESLKISPTSDRRRSPHESAVVAGGQ